MAEKRTIELEVKSDVKPLKAQLKEAVTELQKMVSLYGEQSEQAVTAAKRAAQLKDQIEDTNDILKTYKGEGAFLAMGKAMTAVSAGFTAVEGGLALIGVEGESVRLTMLKVQAAMALTQGLEGLEDAGRAFSTLNVKIKDTFKGLTSESSLAGKATSALSPVWKAVGISGKTSLSAIRAGIAATGIGLLVIALGAIVAYWDDIKAAVGGVSSEMKNNLKIATKNAEQSKKELDNFSLQENSLRLQGKSEKEILELRIKKQQASLKDAKTQLEAQIKIQKASEVASERNYKITRQIMDLMTVSPILTIIDLASAGIIGLMKTTNKYMQQFQSVIIDALGKPIEMALKGANQVSKLLGLGSVDVKGIMGDLTKFATDSTKKINETIQQLKPTNLQKQIGGAVSGWLTKQIFDPAAVKEEGEKTLEELSKNVMSIESEIAGGQLKLNEINNKASAKQAKDQIKANTSMTEYLIALEAERQAKITDAREKELQEAANKYDELTALADKAGQSTTEIDKKYIEQRAEINKKFDTLEKEERAKAEAEALEKMIAADAAAFEIEKTNRQFRIDGMKEGKEKELEVIDLAYDSELLALNNQLDAKTLSEEEYQKQKVLMEEKYGAQIAETNKKFDEEDKARREAALQRNADLAKSGLSAISDLTELFGKKSEKQAKRAFQIKKAASISSALIDTFLSARSAYYSQFTPVPDPSSPVRGGIAAGIAVASGLIGVAKIASQKFEGGGSVSGGGGGGAGGGGGMGGGSQAPSFNVVGNNGLNQLAQLQQQPTQAYVVSGQVTTAQSLDRNRVQNATL